MAKVSFLYQNNSNLDQQAPIRSIELQIWLGRLYCIITKVKACETPKFQGEKTVHTQVFFVWANAIDFDLSPESDFIFCER